MRRVDRDAREYWRVYLPDVPFEQLCRMTLGKDEPGTPAEHFQVSERIIRESETRLDSQQRRAAEAEAAMTPAELDAERERWLR